jgi:hypothetical protein
MKGFTKFMTKIPARYYPDISRTISHAADVVGNPNATSEEQEGVERELRELNQTVGLDAIEAWQEELEEHLRAVRAAAGLEDVDKPTLTKVLEMAEKIRGYAPSMLEILRRHLKWWRVQYFFAVMFAAVSAISISNGLDQGARMQVEQSMERRTWEREVSLNEVRRMSDALAQLSNPRYVPTPLLTPIAPSIRDLPIEVRLEGREPFVRPLREVAAELPEKVRNDFINHVAATHTEASHLTRQVHVNTVSFGSSFGSFTLGYH